MAKDPKIDEIDWDIREITGKFKREVAELKATRRQLMREKNDHTPKFELLLKLITVAAATICAGVVAWVGLIIVVKYLPDVEKLSPWLVALSALGGAFIGVHYTLTNDRFA